MIMYLALVACVGKRAMPPDELEGLINLSLVPKIFVLNITEIGKVVVTLGRYMKQSNNIQLLLYNHFIFSYCASGET